ncbi:hypothetical protein P8C59_000485 [Phyllachora maydis]|uniref:Uncharacterized protein n=1 Tax=Phyllachora maydis TaxID=1825666 RepID=A0AAD9HW75_9PEZI|nr:hypothetical protein P8C59_000485 [Phyllachora maydis]
MTTTRADLGTLFKSRFPGHATDSRTVNHLGEEQHVVNACEDVEVAILMESWACLPFEQAVKDESDLTPSLSLSLVVSLARLFHLVPQTLPWRMSAQHGTSAHGNGPDKEDCDRFHPEEDRSRLANMVTMSPALIRQTILENYMATASYDATIKIWDISGETAEEVRTLRGHTRGIRALQFDENKLISGGLDNLIKVWNWHTGECISTMKCHSDGVIGLHFENDYLVSGSADKSVKVFNFKSKETFCLRGHDDWANSVRVHSASRTVISASDDCTIKMWDMDSKRCICTLTGHVGHVQQVLLLPEDFEPDDEILGTATAPPDGQDAASVSSERSSSPVAAASGPHEACREDEVRAMYGPAFASDPSRQLPRRYILTGGLDSTIRLWDTATGHRGPVMCVSLSESRMASGGEDGEIRLYTFDGTGNVAEIGTPN